MRASGHAADERLPFHFLLTFIVSANSELSFLLLLLREHTLLSLAVLKMLSLSLGLGSLSVYA